ncbi:MAG: enoyl-CoA hydratase/isomerase family protein [Sphingomonadaceae bacterium]
MTQEIVAFVEGKVGRIRLNRPKAIHALNLGMCEAMIAVLLEWRNEPAVEAVLIDHMDGRGFCAGGDVRALADSARGDKVEARTFFHTEYRLNHLLFVYPKPVIAIIDGITMGGGVGISMPANYRVATERTMFAMPETGIGLFPDVGGGRYLSRLPGRVGQYVALTGARLDGADCLALGLATHYLESSRLEDAKARLVANPQDVETVLADLSSAPPAAAIEGLRADIDRLFAAERYEDVLVALAADGGAWATKQHQILATKSPQSCKVSLRQLREAANIDNFADEMRMEYAIAWHVVARPDFPEGVRALLIDKDNNPQWDPSTPEGVDDALIDAIFQPLDAADAWTPIEEGAAN